MSTSRIVLIAGPPCAGKSTLAESLGYPVIDWDRLYARLTRLPLHVRSEYVTDEKTAERRFREDVENRHRLQLPTTVIRGAPERWVRGMYRRLYRAKVIVLAVPLDVCLERLHAAGRPESVVVATEKGIRGWWTRYQPSPNDEVRTEASEATTTVEAAADAGGVPQ